MGLTPLILTLVQFNFKSLALTSASLATLSATLWLISTFVDGKSVSGEMAGKWLSASSAFAAIVASLVAMLAALIHIR